MTGDEWADAVGAAVAEFKASETKVGVDEKVLPLLGQQPEPFDRAARKKLLGLVKPLFKVEWRSGRWVRDETEPIVAWLVDRWPRRVRRSLFAWLLRHADFLSATVKHMATHGAASDLIDRLPHGDRRFVATAVAELLPRGRKRAILAALAANPDPSATLNGLERLADSLDRSELRRLLERLPGVSRARLLDRFDRIAVGRLENLVFEIERFDFRGRGDDRDDLRYALLHTVSAVSAIYSLPTTWAKLEFVERLQAVAGRHGPLAARDWAVALQHVLPSENASQGVHAQMMGLHLPRAPRIIEHDVIRPSTLRKLARLDEGSIDAFLKDAGMDERFDHAVREWDKLRDRLADAQRARHEVVAEKRLSSSSSPEGNERFWSDRVDELRRDVERFDERHALTTRSTKLADALTSFQITWTRFEPDALLGEFNPIDGSITIYRQMLRIVARSLGAPPFIADVEHALREIAMAHELAHAYLISGRDCAGHAWSDYDRSSHRLHEILATAYTSRAIAASADMNTEFVWNMVEAMLPADYRMGLAANHEPEELRRHVLHDRAGRRSRLPESWFEGDPVGRGSLRIRFDWVPDRPTQSTLPNDRDNKPAIGGISDDSPTSAAKQVSDELLGPRPKSLRTRKLEIDDT